MGEQKPTIAQQYHAGLSTLSDNIVEAILEILRYQGNQVSVSKTGNFQQVIKKDQINASFRKAGLEVHVTNDYYVQGDQKVLENL